MTPRIPEYISIWLVDWRGVTIMGNTMPPRDPNDDDDDDADDDDHDHDDDHDDDDAEDEDEDEPDDEDDPAVVREPDEPDE